MIVRGTSLVVASPACNHKERVPHPPRRACRSEHTHVIVGAEIRIVSRAAPHIGVLKPQLEVTCLAELQRGRRRSRRIGTARVEGRHRATVEAVEASNGPARAAGVGIATAASEPCDIVAHRHAVAHNERRARGSRAVRSEAQGQARVCGSTRGSRSTFRGMEIHACARATSDEKQKSDAHGVHGAGLGHFRAKGQVFPVGRRLR